MECKIKQNTISSCLYRALLNMVMSPLTGRRRAARHVHNAMPTINSTISVKKKHPKMHPYECDVQ